MDKQIYIKALVKLLPIVTDFKIESYLDKDKVLIIILNSDYDYGKSFRLLSSLVNFKINKDILNLLKSTERHKIILGLNLLVYG